MDPRKKLVRSKTFHSNDKRLSFWDMIKEGNEIEAKTKSEPSVETNTDAPTPKPKT